MKGRFLLPEPDPPTPLDPNSDNATDIAIIGAGPSGLLTACLLKQHDPTRDVKIFDMRPRPTSFFGSFPVVLNKRGLTALEKLGPELVEKVNGVGRDVDGIRIMSSSDENPVAKVDTYGLCIMRDQLVGLLLEKADSLKIPMYWNHKLVEMDTDHRQVSLERSSNNDTDTTPPEKITVKVSKALVGADGNYSRVRRECASKNLVSVQEWDWGIRMRYLLAPNNTTKPLPPNIDGRYHYVLGSDGYICQQPDGDWSMSYSIHDDRDDDENEALTSNDPTPSHMAVLKQRTHAMAKGFAEHLFDNDEKIYSNYFENKVFGGCIIKCSTLAPKDWIALIGDAAHAVAPFTGEGVNSALESASLLSETFLRGNTCSDYDAIRRDDAHALCQIALRNRKLVSGTPVQKCTNTFGTIVLGILKKMGCVKYSMEDLMLGAKAKERPDPVPYSELIDMDGRQRCCLNVIGACCFYTVCFTCCGKCD